MFDFALIINDGIPKGAITTPYAMMPRILCCIEGEGAKVYVNRKIIREFKFFDNGLKKSAKVRVREEAKAYRIYKGVTKAKPLLLTSNEGENDAK